MALWLSFFNVGLWNFADGLMADHGFCSDTPYINDIKQALIFLSISSIIETLIALPATIYDTFVIEEKYGFNKTTVSTFVKDKIKTYILTMIIFGILIPIILWVVKKSGPALVPALTGIVVGFIIIF